MNTLRKTMLAFGLLAMSGGVASALPAVVANDLNLRAGPGTQYGVITAMPQGTIVDAWSCNGGWCQVNYGGETGFASERYLNPGSAGYVRGGYQNYAYAPRYRYDRYPGPLGFPLFPWNWNW